ncbi:unnamed protein product [Adineta ricciae]|nr:unnamed protein product [Adineta ricciae]
MRVIYHKYKRNHRMEWRNYRKMSAQLLPISFLYLVLSFPPMILYAAYAFGLSADIGYEYFQNSLFFFYWVILFTPFMSILSLPDLKNKFHKFFFFWKNINQIYPEILTMTRLRRGQTTIIAQPPPPPPPVRQMPTIVN